LKERVVD